MQILRYRSQISWPAKTNYWHLNKADRQPVFCHHSAVQLWPDFKLHAAWVWTTGNSESNTWLPGGDNQPHCGHCGCSCFITPCNISKHIHPFSASYLGHQYELRCSALSVPSHSLQPGWHRDVPRPAKRCNLCVLGLPWGFLPLGHDWNASPRRCPEGILVSYPSHCCRLLALLLNDWTPYPIFKVKPRHCLEETHSHHLNPGSQPSGHYPDLMGINKGRNDNWPVNEQHCFHTQLSLHHRRWIWHLNFKILQCFFWNAESDHFKSSTHWHHVFFNR